MPGTGLVLRYHSEPEGFLLLESGKFTQSCLTLCDPMDCSLLGLSVHEIFQAIVLEWAAISFSKLHVVNRKMQPDFRDLRKWAT